MFCGVSCSLGAKNASDMKYYENEKVFQALLSDVLIDLPDLLRDQARWDSLKVTYEEPHVHRLFTDYMFHGENYRINLHQIFSCERPLFHPHPWPSIVKVFGTYEMLVGTGDSREGVTVAGNILLKPSCVYTMLDPRGWHSVKPLDLSSFSLMVTGPPWKGEEGAVSSDFSRDFPLSAERIHLVPEEKQQIIQFFSGQLPS